VRWATHLPASGHAWLAGAREIASTIRGGLSFGAELPKGPGVGKDFCADKFFIADD
jgi:hypothetical protein